MRLKSQMDKTQVKKKIDEMVKDIVEGLKRKLGIHIESITLCGSYATGKISFERPNVNILVFVKPDPTAEFYLRIGRILYCIGKKYAKFFRFRVDPFPFRFAKPVGDKELEVSVNLNLYEMTDKDLEMWITPEKKIKTPFGAPGPVIQNLKATRKVVFGTDVLGKIELLLAHEDILLNVLKEFPGVYRLQLTRAPMTYDIDKDYELLATEALEIGKSCLASAVGVLLDEESIRQGKQLEILVDKKKMLEFFKKSGSQDLAKWAEIILTARDNFLKIKKDKKKVFELYNAAYNVLNLVLGVTTTQLLGKKH